MVIRHGFRPKCMVIRHGFRPKCGRRFEIQHVHRGAWCAFSDNSLVSGRLVGSVSFTSLDPWKFTQRLQKCWNMLKPRSLRNIDKNHDDCNHPTASIVSFLGRWRFVGRVPGVLHPHLEDLSWNCFDGEDFQQMGKQLMQTKPGCLVFDFRCVACVARRSSPVSSVLYFSHPFTCSLHLFTSEFTHFYPMLTTSLQALQSALWRMPSPFWSFWSMFSTRSAHPEGFKAEEALLGQHIHNSGKFRLLHFWATWQETRSTRSTRRHHGTTSDGWP